MKLAIAACGSGWQVATADREKFGDCNGKPATRGGRFSQSSAALNQGFDGRTAKNIPEAGFVSKA